MIVAHTGATYHVTGDLSCMFECKPPPVGKSKLMVADMRSLDINCFGDLSMEVHSADGDLDVTLPTLLLYQEHVSICFPRMR